MTSTGATVCCIFICNDPSCASGVMPWCQTYLSGLHAWLYMDGQHLRLALQLDVGTLLAHLQGQPWRASSVVVPLG